MFRPIQFISIFAILTTRTAVDAGETFVSHAFEMKHGSRVRKIFSVAVTDEALKKTPSWKNGAENPPLPARTAMKFAAKMKDKLVKDSNEYEWKFENLALKRHLSRGGAEKWYWLAHFEAKFWGGSTGRPPYLDVVILMDGEVIEPVVLKKDPEKE